MPAINDKTTLENLLQKMYWIEAEMEQLGTWEARIELMDENIDALEILSHDSDKHWSIIKKWLIRSNTSIPESTPPGLQKQAFDFEDMSAQEMFRTIMKYEILAKNVYEDIKGADPGVIKQLLHSDEDISDFLNDIDQLIKDEEKHASICKRIVGGYQKIMY